MNEQQETEIPISKILTSSALLCALKKLESLELSPYEAFIIKSVMLVKEWCDTIDRDLREMTFDEIIEEGMSRESRPICPGIP